MENAFGNWIATKLDRWRTILLLIGVVIGAFSLPLSRTLRLDWQLDRMFAPGDPLVSSYHRLEDRFGGNEVVIAVYRDPQLWSPAGEGLERLEVISEQLAKVEPFQCPDFMMQAATTHDAPTQPCLVSRQSPS